MAYLLIKRGKFMEGHSYCSGFGYSFAWTRDEQMARRFSDCDNIDLFCNLTGAKPVRRANSRLELVDIGRERARIRQAGFRAPDVHTTINFRAVEALAQQRSPK